MARKTKAGVYDELLGMTITCIGFFELCRLGELLWPDKKEYQVWRKVTRRSEVRFETDTAVIKLTYQKNDQFAQGTEVTLKRHKRLVNPIFFLRRYLIWRDEKHGARPALFVKEDGSVPTRSWFLAFLREKCGTQYAGHSLRSGEATELAKAGHSLGDIMRARRWNSEAFRLYIREQPDLGDALRRGMETG